MFSADLGVTPSAANYIEDVFSTYLYTGNGSTQTITNGIDLSTYGGLVWMKRRSGANAHALYDTARGATFDLVSNTTAAQTTQSTGLTSFGSTGFSIGTLAKINTSADTYASWTFRKQAKFFDVVTYTGNSTAGRQISHNLGAVPGCIIIKKTSDTENWGVYHRSLDNTASLALNLTNASGAGFWNSTTPTDTVFTIGNQGQVNDNGQTYVAYLFAHDAGGFGAAGTDNVISCGSYTGNGSATGPVITLGYEPQWILIKQSSASGNDWQLYDSMRGLVTGDGGDNGLFPNTTATEDTNSTIIKATATGFQLETTAAALNASSATFIYIAIRRGPMKTPTSGTSVFSPLTSSGATGTTLTTNFPVDMLFTKYRSGAASNPIVDRLRGVSTNSTEQGSVIYTNSTAAESGTAGESLAWSNTGFQIPGNWGGISNVFYPFRRAPGFFDVVCYTGDGTLTPISHNLAVSPDLVIVKRRSSANGWYVSQYLSSPSYGKFETTAAFVSQGSSYPVTSTTFVPVANTSVQTFVAYLFATCPGVSKVGSYTGTGSTQTIDCGFTGGARFVLIKRTDTTGDWYVWDTARGMVSGTDPSLLLNSTAAEVNANSVYTTGVGFQIVSTAAGINASGGTYIYLAIA